MTATDAVEHESAWPPTPGAPDARYLVLSDMHFGTPESSVNDPRYRGALVNYIASRAPWKEIVLTGDLLDVNLSTLVRALEGGPGLGGGPAVVGFRTFVEELDGAMKHRGAPGLDSLAENWVYVPGNHDYKVWDLLAANAMSVNVIAAGRSLRSVHPPLAQAKWANGTSFFAGVFRAFASHRRVAVEYPDHVLSFGESGRMVLTHGHYIDASQTRFRSLVKTLAGVAPPALQKAARDIVIETAQYQAVANAVSFRRDTTQWVARAVGPDGWVDRLKNLVFGLASSLISTVLLRKGTLRGEDLTPRQLAAIDVYLRRFRSYDPMPRWFVFGHTHRQGRGRAGDQAVQVYNVGSCYADRGMPITFLEIATDATISPTVRLLCVDSGGVVRDSGF